MSFLHITYKGRKITIHLDDGKSDLLDRYVDLDDGSMYYTMGKQIGGKPINPNGQVGREILRIANYWANKPEAWERSKDSAAEATKQQSKYPGCLVTTLAWMLSLYSCSKDQVGAGFALFIIGPVLDLILDSAFHSRPQKRNKAEKKKISQIFLKIKHYLNRTKSFLLGNPHRKKKILLYILPIPLYFLMTYTSSLVPESPVDKVKKINNERMNAHNKAYRALKKARAKYDALSKYEIWDYENVGSGKQYKMRLTPKADKLIKALKKAEVNYAKHPRPQKYPDYVDPKNMKDIILTPMEQKAKVVTLGIKIFLVIYFCAVLPFAMFHLNKRLFSTNKE